MTYSNELYQQVTLEHNKKPRNFRKMEDATHNCHGYNPFCGDDYEIYLNVDEARVVFEEFHKMVLGEFDPENNEHHLGKLTLFQGHVIFPRESNARAFHGIPCHDRRAGQKRSG